MTEIRERLMDQAEASMRAGGYHAFSFRALAAGAGIKSASVHHHFPTKAEMTTSVLQRYGDRLLSRTTRAAEGGDVGIEKIYREIVREDFLHNGNMCLGGILAAEIAALPAEVVRKVEGFFRRCIVDLANRSAGSNSEARALRVFATLEGALILARAFDDVSVYDMATMAIGSKPR
jgi:TetR/AcrR family transcriptional regulator, transcriptional repressor for nem operon